MRIVEMVRNDIKNSSLLKTKFLIYAFNGRTIFMPYKHNTTSVGTAIFHLWLAICGISLCIL